ncbi:unnamed protein product [Cochlearia groenlandica]
MEHERCRVDQRYYERQALAVFQEETSELRKLADANGAGNLPEKYRNIDIDDYNRLKDEGRQLEILDKYLQYYETKEKTKGESIEKEKTKVEEELVKVKRDQTVLAIFLRFKKSRKSYKDPEDLQKKATS